MSREQALEVPVFDRLPAGRVSLTVPVSPDGEILANVFSPHEMFDASRTAELYVTSREHLVVVARQDAEPIQVVGYPFLSVTQACTIEASGQMKRLFVKPPDELVFGKESERLWRLHDADFCAGTEMHRDAFLRILGTKALEASMKLR